VSPGSRSCPHRRRHEAAAHSPAAPGAGLCRLPGRFELDGVHGLIPISFALVGPLAAWLGADTVLAGAGIAGSLITASFYFLPGMRNTETPGHPEHVHLTGSANLAVRDEEGSRRLPVASLSSDES
jgi:hypothetical protein